MSLGKIIAIIILPFLIPLICTVAALWTIHLDVQNDIRFPVLGFIFILLPSWGIYIGGVIGAKGLAKNFEDYTLWVIFLVPFISHIAIGFYILSLFVIGAEKIGDAWNS